MIVDSLEGRLPDDELVPAEVRPAIAVTRVYEGHARFVWASLQRLGVRDADLEDVLQEVFVVVHQRLHTFDGTSKMTTCLFGICLRVASASRRRSFRQNETCVAARLSLRLT